MSREMLLRACMVEQSILSEKFERPKVLWYVSTVAKKLFLCVTSSFTRLSCFV